MSAVIAVAVIAGIWVDGTGAHSAEWNAASHTWTIDNVSTSTVQVDATTIEIIASVRT
jgi:hypothetical protein